MSRFLLGKPLLELFHQAIKASQTFDCSPFFICEKRIKMSAQPVVRNHVQQQIVQNIKLPEITRKCPVKSIKIFFILDHAKPGQQVKLIQICKRKTFLQTFKQRKQLYRADRYALLPECCKKADKHL